MMDWKLSRLLVLGLCLGVAACDNGEADDATDDTDGTTDTDETPGTDECDSAVEPVQPQAGANDFYYRGTFIIDFDDGEEGTASFTLKDADGAEVEIGSITWQNDGETAIFEAATPLAPETDYVLEITYSCTEQDGGPTTLAFTTGATGTEIGTPADLIGNTYEIDLGSDFTILEPAGVGDILMGFLGDLGGTSIAVEVAAYDDTDDALTFFGGLVENGAQDECTPTLVFPQDADFSENPYFEIDAPDGLPISVSDFSITLGDLLLAGSFSPDATSIEGVRLEASIDTRDLGDLLDGQDACGLIEAVAGVSCEPCPTDSEPACLSLVAVGISAPQVNYDFVEITQAEVDANPACADDE